jgi:hypothetical protein
MAQLVWYIAQTRDTGNIKKLVESYHVMSKGGWVSDYGPIYPAEPHNQMRYWVKEWSGLEILDEDGPFWIPISGNWTSTPRFDCGQPPSPKMAEDRPRCSTGDRSGIVARPLICPRRS